MSGYHIKQMVFILVGLCFGIVTGNQVCRTVATHWAWLAANKVYGSTAVEAHPAQYRAEVREAANEIYEKELHISDSRHTFPLLLIYGVTCFAGLWLGAAFAGDRPLETTKE
jgi:hypothetical protein